MPSQVWPKIQAYNMEFLRTKAFYDLEPRSITDVVPEPETVNDGDFFGVLVSGDRHPPVIGRLPIAPTATPVLVPNLSL